MAEDRGNKRPTVEELCSDPRYVEEKNFLWGCFDKYVAEKAAQQPPKKEPGFLEGLLGPFAE